MVTILQADKNFKNNSNYMFLKKNIEYMNKNKNNFSLFIDDDYFKGYTDLKIIKLLDILKKYPDGEIIMYIDAFDTMVMCNDEEIENKFINFNADVVYSYEFGIWPDPNFAKYYNDGKYLNSGTIIFKNKKYQRILEISKILYDGRLTYNCDQYYHTIFNTIISQDINIKLDKNNELFQSVWNEINVDFVSNFENVEGRIRNKTTNTLPCVIHGNGTNGTYNLTKMFFPEHSDIFFQGLTENKMGINFINLSKNDYKVKAEIKNKNNQIIYFSMLDLHYNISYFISANTLDDYIFTIYDINNFILLQEKNF